ncbi:MAG: iron ABC transporter substrate-binding protein [Deltaproteobacteria bacterium]|nr:MAG: iron ABC transporter substrate-binding protein [Deltaproteobacteria bacterium]
MKRFPVLFIIFFACLSLPHRAMGTTLTIRDMAGRTVSLQGRANRIICLGPGALRLIVYLHAADRVVGVEDIEKRFPLSRPYWVANQWLEKLPTIGPGGPGAINKMPDMEAVLAARPDLIFVSYMERAKADLLQSRLGIPVVALSYGDEGTINKKIYDSLRVAGKVLCLEHRAEQVISFIERSKNYLISAIRGYPEGQKPTVYAGCIGYRGLHGIGSTEANYLPFEWVRARNVAKEIKARGHVFVDREQILSWDPQVIFVDSAGLPLLKQDYFKKRKFYNSLRAFKEKRVYILYPYNWYATNVGTAISDAYAVAKVLYPEIFKNMELRTKVDEIYTFLVGHALYSKMINAYGLLLDKPDFLK